MTGLGVVFVLLLLATLVYFAVRRQSKPVLHFTVRVE